MLKVEHISQNCATCFSNQVNGEHSICHLQNTACNKDSTSVQVGMQIQKLLKKKVTQSKSIGVINSA